MKCVVTGAAGFIGSHLCEHLLALGHDVYGVDCYFPYYPRAIKEENQHAALTHPRYTFLNVDLRSLAPGVLPADADVVFHLAAMPGLTRSWTHFEDYWTCNVQATKALLDEYKGRGKDAPKILYASTSSVYGKFASGDESLPTRPVSPYGVTKLAGENLCRAYADAFNMPVVTLRFFSVYGPRQRPDMGYHQFIRSVLIGQPIQVCGDGQQARGNTFVADCVRATIAAAGAPAGEIFNVGGGEVATLWEIIKRIEDITGRRAIIERVPARAGDQRYTFADTEKLSTRCNWSPRVGLDEGLRSQVEWHAKNLTIVA